MVLPTILTERRHKPIPILSREASDHAVDHAKRGYKPAWVWSWHTQMIRLALGRQLSHEYIERLVRNMETLLIKLFWASGIDTWSFPSGPKSYFERMMDLNLRLREIDQNRTLPELVMGVLIVYEPSKRYGESPISSTLWTSFRAYS